MTREGRTSRAPKALEISLPKLVGLLMTSLMCDRTNIVLLPVLTIIGNSVEPRHHVFLEQHSPRPPHMLPPPTDLSSFVLAPPPCVGATMPLN